MNNWKLKYLVEQSQKSASNKYQLIITNLFLFDRDLFDYQPRVEYYIAGRRIDLFYEGINLAIEVDEPHHLKNKEDDRAREAEIKMIRPEIEFVRIDINEHNWYEQFLTVKSKILSRKPKPWDEADVVDGFKEVDEIDTYEIGGQIISISKYLFSNMATSTTKERYSGVYVNNTNNTINEFYVSIVCYKNDFKDKSTRISFLLLDDEVLANHKDLFLSKGWKEGRRTVKCLLKFLSIDDDYLNQSKEMQFQTLKKFIINNFMEVQERQKRINDEYLNFLS